jgi:recombinational DNA repair protein (RecF pathway)
MLFPPVYGLFTLARGHSPVRILAGIEPEEHFADWRKDAKHLQVAGVMLATLEGLDAPVAINQEALGLVLQVLKLFAARPMNGLVVFTVRMLDILGLLGGETTCTICGKEIAQGMAAASPDLQTFICRNCYNRIYGNKEVSIIFVDARHLQLLKRIAYGEMEKCLDTEIDSEGLALILDLAEKRLRDALPLVAAALVPLAAEMA